MTAETPGTRGTIIRVRAPASAADLAGLRAGDIVSISGTVYTARDAAHARLAAAIARGERLPVELEGQFIYHVGPAPAKPGHAAGPAGPTTSSRMDPYSPALLDRGMKGMIGKGLLSRAVVEAMVRNGAVFFGATGGAAALIARSILKVEVVAYPDLGTEAIHRLTIEDFPAIVVIDSLGNDLYLTEPPKYRAGK